MGERSRTAALAVSKIGCHSNGGRVMVGGSALRLPPMSIARAQFRSILHPLRVPATRYGSDHTIVTRDRTV